MLKRHGRRKTKQKKARKRIATNLRTRIARELLALRVIRRTPNGALLVQATSALQRCECLWPYHFVRPRPGRTTSTPTHPLIHPPTHPPTHPLTSFARDIDDEEGLLLPLVVSQVHFPADGVCHLEVEDGGGLRPADTIMGASSNSGGTLSAHVGQLSSAQIRSSQIRSDHCTQISCISLVSQTFRRGLIDAGPE